MAQFFHRSANNIARISMIFAVIFAGLAFYVYTQVARSTYLTGRYVEKQQPVQFKHVAACAHVEQMQRHAFQRHARIRRLDHDIVQPAGPGVAKALHHRCK